MDILRSMKPSPSESFSLESLPQRRQATVAAIDWTHLSTPEARRLRELGFDEGVDVEVLHRATLGQGPIACRIGRMTIAMRRSHAAAVTVRTGPERIASEAAA